MERCSKQREINEWTNKTEKEDDRSSDTPPANFPQVFLKQGFFLRFLGNGRGQMSTKCKRKHKKEARESKETRNDFPQVFTTDFS